MTPKMPRRRKARMARRLKRRVRRAVERSDIGQLRRCYELVQKYERFLRGERS